MSRYPVPMTISEHHPTLAVPVDTVGRRKDQPAMYQDSATIPPLGGLDRNRGCFNSTLNDVVHFDDPVSYGADLPEHRT